MRLSTPRLQPEDLHHRSGPFVVSAFADFSIELAGDHQIEALELEPEFVEVEEQVRILRSARPEFELPPMKALENKSAAGRQPEHTSAVKISSNIRGHMTENRNNALPPTRLDVESRQIRLDGCDLHSALGRKGARFFEADGRRVDSRHLVPEGRKEYRVSPFALCQAQHATGRNPIRHGSEKAVLFFAVRISWLRKPFIPHCRIMHQLDPGAPRSRHHEAVWFTEASAQGGHGSG